MAKANNREPMARDDDPKPGPNANGDRDADGPVPPLKPFAAHGHHGHHGPARGPLAPPRRTPDLPSAPARPGTVANQTSAAAHADVATALGDENARLHIARDVRLSGAITSVDKLMVDGQVDIDLPHARVLVVGSHGRYAGRAAVDHADIAGVFEGELTVAGRLTIRTGGRVSGTVVYANLHVETGGELSGTAQKRTPPTPPKQDTP